MAVRTAANCNDQELWNESYRIGWADKGSERNCTHRGALRRVAMEAPASLSRVNSLSLEHVMEFPGFFAAVEGITLHDPLSAFLGASRNGVLTYTYVDAVKLAGHSCPTVAGAYIMVRRGLKALYGEDLPERGGVEVYFRDARDRGTTGVTAAIATLLTGAAHEVGFGGIGPGGRFRRRNLLHFDAPIDSLMALRRCDNGRGVLLDLDLSSVPSSQEIQALFPRVLSEQATENEQADFAIYWQARVEDILVRHVHNPTLVRIREWETET